MTNQILLMLAGSGGAAATFILQKYGFSAVVASSAIGLSGASLAYLFSNPHLAPVIFAGSFVGMTALSLTSIPIIALAGASAGLIYTLTLNIFAGYGGRLGTIAFVSTVVIVWITSLFSKK